QTAGQAIEIRNVQTTINNQFDSSRERSRSLASLEQPAPLPLGELTKSLAQSVTRRAALNQFGVGLAGMALARFGLNNAQAITNGVLDGHAHPNVGGVAWLVSPWPDAQAPVVCGSGSVIHPSVYLTAGHGTYLVKSLIAQGILTLNDLRVSFAPNAFDSTTWRPVSGILTHPDFAPNA